MENENQEILRKLNKIQIDIDFLKSRIIDPDCILTPEEEEELEEARREYERGETTSLEDFEKEMNQIRKK